MRDSEGARLLTNCILTDDNKQSGTLGNGSICCSKELGYCIECPGQQDLSCVMTTYRLLPPDRGTLDNVFTRPGDAAISPAPKSPTLRDRLKRPQSTISAPAKVVVPSKPPTVKPIKQYEQRKAPEKVNQK